MYRFHQVLNATLSPAKALELNTPSHAMLGGIFLEAAVAELLGFPLQLPEGVEFTQVEREEYEVQAGRCAQVLNEEPYMGLLYQPALVWPSVEDPLAEGHPDFCEFSDDHIVDLKSTEYPTEDKLYMHLHSVQMAAYCAAYKRNYDRSPKLTIILASRLEAPHPVSFNKNGDVSLSGQKGDYMALKEAVELMGDRADERHWAMVYKAPVWTPMLIGTLEHEECDELAKVGEIFLDSGLKILNTGLAGSVVRAYV